MCNFFGPFAMAKVVDVDDSRKQQFDTWVYTHTHIPQIIEVFKFRPVKAVADHTTWRLVHIVYITHILSSPFLP